MSIGLKSENKIDMHQLATVVLRRSDDCLVYAFGRLMRRHIAPSVSALICYKGKMFLLLGHKHMIILNRNCD